MKKPALVNEAVYGGIFEMKGQSEQQIKKYVRRRIDEIVSAQLKVEWDRVDDLMLNGDPSKSDDIPLGVLYSSASLWGKPVIKTRPLSKKAIRKILPNA